MAEKTVKYPDDWSKKDLAAFVKEEQEAKERFVKECKELRAQVASYKWQLTRLREIAALHNAMLAPFEFERSGDA